jgi:hypothetical protein
MQTLAMLKAENDRLNKALNL